MIILLLVSIFCSSQKLSFGWGLKISRNQGSENTVRKYCEGTWMALGLELRQKEGRGRIHSRSHHAPET